MHLPFLLNVLLYACLFPLKSRYLCRMCTKYTRNCIMCACVCAYIRYDVCLAHVVDFCGVFWLLGSGRGRDFFCLFSTSRGWSMGGCFLVFSSYVRCRRTGHECVWFTHFNCGTGISQDRRTCHATFCFFRVFENEGEVLCDNHQRVLYLGGEYILNRI